MGQDESAPTLPSDAIHLSLARLKLNRIPFFIPPNHPVTQIDAPHNMLQTLPKCLEHLESLDLSDNSLYTLQERLHETDLHFKSLKTLRLSSNHLFTIPEAVNELESLQELSLDRNRLECVELSNTKIAYLDLFLNNIAQFPILPDSITSLNLGFNHIKGLSVYMPHIRELRLAGNDLNEITETCSFPELIFLDLSFNRLVAIPPISSFAPKLELLNLSFNFLSQFPKGLPNTITKIEISHNCLVEWTDQIELLDKLTFLDIHENKFTEIPKLPKSIEKLMADDNLFETAMPINLPGIRGIQFNHNSFTEIPIFSECKVTHLLMRNNKLINLNTDAISPTIKLMDFTSNFLKSIPISIFEFKTLTTLLLTKNLITDIPPEIIQSNITILNISDNPINSLPDLPETLKEIYACNCRFVLLPHSLFTLPDLQTLNFSKNLIEEIPELPEVENIMLSQNKILVLPSIPEFISSLDLSHNKLTAFSPDLDLPFLQNLDLSHNNITNLNLPSLPSLQIIKLSHNPLNMKLDLSQYPQIDTVDLCCTEIKHTFPLPASIRECITPDSKLLKSNTTTQLKYFRGTKCGYSEAIGSRPSMEDSLIIRENLKPKTPSLYGVIDGHGGFKTSALAASLIPHYFEKSENKSISGMTTVLKQVNEQLTKMQVNDGATIVIATVAPSLVSVAHLGDARALVVKRNGDALALTFDHKPTERSELDVLKQGRAFVASGRLSSHLAVSRALGDFQVDGVSRTPDLTTYFIKDDDYRLVLACDGVFDVLENDEVAKIVAEEPNVHESAALVKNMAIVRGTSDNVSVIVIDIEKEPDQ